jgi:hypothetical protein
VTALLNLAMKMPSHADDGAAESCWQRCCRVLLVTALLNPVMKMLSHAGDDAARVTWPRCDVDTESCS